MEEVWKDIKDYEGLYMVSNEGKVKSLDRISVSIRNGRRQNIKGAILKATKAFNGYYCVGLYCNGKVKRNYVHRLVAEAFITNPHHLPQVNHKDEDKSNNCVENLEWCTARYNINYGNTKNKISIANRNNDYLSKPISQYDKDGKFIKEYPCASQAQRETGIDASSIRKVCNNIPKHNTAGGYIWKNTDEKTRTNN